MRIKNYSKDTNVTANDKWIGSDFNNSGETKNFTPTTLAEYFNHNQVIDSTYLKFKYQTLLPGEAREQGTISFETEIGPSIPFSSISTFLVSENSLKGNNISEYLNFLNGGKIILSRGEDVNDFGFYEVTNIEPYITDELFYVVTLEYIDGHGSMVEDKDYIVSLLIDKYTVTNSLPSNLQNVTDIGNETTNDIVLNSYPGKYGDYTVINTIQDLGMFNSFSSPTQENYSSYYAGYGFGLSASLNTYSTDISGYEGSFYVSSHDSSNSLFNGSIGLIANDANGSPYLSIINSSGKEGRLKATNLTNNNVVLQFPNKTTGVYTIATTKDLQRLVPYNGATDDVNLGLNYLTFGEDNDNSILVGVYTGIVLNSLVGSDPYTTGITSDKITSRLTNTNQQVSLSCIDGLSLTTNATGFQGIIKSDLLTTFDRYYQLPDNSGTFALLTDIPSFPTIGTWGGLDYPTWSSGTPFVKMTAAGTFALDTNTYLTGITSSQITTALGYTPVPTTRTLNINGTTLDLSSDRSWTIPTFTSPLTTKGDIYVRNATVDTRLPVGSNNQVLVADSTQATGLKWTAQNTPTPIGYYGAFQDTLTQTLASANVGQPFLIRTVDESNQVTITANGSGQLTRITPTNTGVYNIQWSGQFQNPDNAIHDVNVWFRKGLVSSSGPGTDIVGSNGVIAMPSRKSATAGDEGHVVAGWNFLLTIAAGEYVEFYWMSDSTQITLHSYAAGSPPPSTASLIVTVTQQSGIMAGTGITAINSLAGASQTLSTGTSGTDFNIVDSGVDHKFNLPTANATNRGALSNTDWSTFNNKQDKSLSAYKMRVNNTNATANATETNFRSQGLQSLSGINFTGTQAPTGGSQSYQWQQEGNKVTATFTGVYSNAGILITQLNIALPSDMPTPIRPTGITATAGNVCYYGIGQMTTALNALNVTYRPTGLVVNAADTSKFDVVLPGVAASYRYFWITITYFIA